MNDEFYIGWEDKMPRGHAKQIRRGVIFLGVVVLLAGVVFARSQRLIGTATFEWGNVREFTGVLRCSPYPHLLPPPGSTNSATVAPLVAPFKFGLNHDAICGFDGLKVSLRATRIQHDGELMLEVEPGSITPERAAAEPPWIAATNIVSLGEQTFRGEIVDSKCWLGVMNPGVLAPHRACAVRCISGGIPPLLLVRRENAPPLNLLLVSTNDQPVNSAVLDFVAEPIELTGEVVRNGNLLTLRIDPTTIRRL